MAKEIKRDLVLANFRPTLRQRKQRRTGTWRKTRPGNDPTHLELIRQLPCCICLSRKEVQAHHLKCGGERGMGLKAPDKFAVPLCAIPHHDEVERIGSRNEMAWFEDKGGFDPLELANALWSAPRDATAMLKIILAQHKG